MELMLPAQPRVEVPYQRWTGTRIQCEVCPQLCTLDEGAIGVCGGRQVIDGRLIAVNYAQVCALNVDPIEKKPLYHFYPGGEILSVGPNGCNLSCAWCRNWQVTQNAAPTRTVLPDELADIVDGMEGIGVAYTYAEPLVWFEYIRDAGRIIRDRGLLNVFITNGYINPEPLREILPIADAFNVDLKSHDDYCYKKFCGGRLEDVQRTIRMVYEAGVHLEITHLVVTGVNDDLRRIEGVAKWVSRLSRSIPLHLARYFPSNRYEAPPTSLEFLRQSYEVARTYLDWVYLANADLDVGNDSLCPSCKTLLVRRRGYQVELVGLVGNRCGGCGVELYFRAA